MYYYVYSADVGRTGVFSYVLLCLQCWCRAYRVFSYILLCLQCWCMAYRGFLLCTIMFTVLVKAVQVFSPIYYYVYSAGVGRTAVFSYIMFTVLLLVVQVFSSMYFYVYSAGVGRRGVFSYVFLCLQCWCRPYRCFLLYIIMFTVLV